VSETVTLSTLGPHSPEYTVTVANALAECVRVLNHATRSDDAIGYPGAVYQVLGAVYTATGRLPQLLSQLSGWLERATEAGRLAEHQHGDVIAAVATAQDALARATAQFAPVTSALEAAQQAIAFVSLRDDGDRPGEAEGEGSA
jgi:hypothetical protein